MSKRRLGALVFVLLAASASTARAQSAGKPVSCSQALGAARAQRIVNQCLRTTTATRPPCNASNDCETIVEHIAYMCKNNLGEHAPAYCGEGSGLAKLSDAAVAERYAATVVADQNYATRARERIKRTRSKLEPLANKNKTAVAAAKQSRAGFDRELKEAHGAYDKYKAAAKKPGATGLDASRQALLAQFEAVVKHGQILAKDAAAISASEQQLSKLTFDVDMDLLGIKDALRDMKEAKTLIDATANRLAKVDAKKKADTANDVANLKALSTQAAASIKATQALETEAGKESSSLHTLASITPAGTQARSQAFTAAKATEQARIKADSRRREIDGWIKAAAARRSPNAPFAKSSGCDLERVDFRNFAYPYPYDPQAAPEVFKNGKLARDEADEFLPKIAGVKYFDLDGNGKKEAVIFIEGPPSAHSGPQNELRFMELDEQCRIQRIATFNGGVYEGTMKGKSYFYSDTVLVTPEGQNGNFAAGTERVEVRYADGELKEISRKAERN